MRAFKTDRRLNRIINTIKARQHSIRVVLENIHDPHNVSAILRTCDAVGIPKISLVYTKEDFPKISRVSSASANKWIERERFTKIKDCYDNLRSNGYKIYATALKENSKDLYSIDFTQKIAVVLGNEHRGVSETAANLADDIFSIPMFGMVQSLNVSVANAVILYEVLRQRRLAGLYSSSELNEVEIDKLIDKWCEK